MSSIQIFSYNVCQGVGGKKLDPEVEKLTKAIEERYPGHVIGVNFERGGLEIDIETRNAIIEVKAGRGKGLGRQVTDRLSGPANPEKKPVIGYSQQLGPHAAREINKRGGIAAGGVACDLEILLEILRPNP